MCDYDAVISLLEMSGSTGGRALRSYRRRKAVLDLDLNRDPPGENRELEDPSNPLEPRSVQAVQPPQVVQPIDVEAIEDDVIESTASAFAEVYLFLGFDVDLIISFSILF